MKNFIIVASVLIFLNVTFAQLTNARPATVDAATAWKMLQTAAELPAKPTAWDTRKPSEDEVQQYYIHRADLALASAHAAKAFYTEFPNDTNAVASEMLECQLFRAAFSCARWHDEYWRTYVFNAWANAQNALLADSRLSDDQRFDVRTEILDRIGSNPTQDLKTRHVEYEAGLHQLVKDYPKKEDAWTELVLFGAESSDAKGREIANEILADPAAPNSARDTARAILRRLDAPGKPLDIQFTALDGRKVNLGQMKGKVVLVDFWATWCGPCVGTIPDIKKAYDTYHPQGFEVVGISFDSSRDKLADFIKKDDLPWPQCFEGNVWNNQFGSRYAIYSIPTMWLVDKKGDLRDTDAEWKLEDRVKKLLAE